MNDALSVQIVTSLLTIVASSVVVHNLNARKDKIEFRRNKLEAIFVAAQQFQQVFSVFMHFWTFAMTKEMFVVGAPS